jgi:hypothetical protein
VWLEFSQEFARLLLGQLKKEGGMMRGQNRTDRSAHALAFVAL